MSKAPIFWLGALFLVAGCPGEEAGGDGACNIDADCPAGEICETGFCEEGERGGNGIADAGAEAPPDAGTLPPDSGPTGVGDDGGGTPGPPDSGDVGDAGSGGRPDAASPMDGGLAPDSGPPSDGGAGIADASPVARDGAFISQDGGALSEDGGAGALDAAGAPDAAMGADSGMADAGGNQGSSDAGARADGNFAPDAGPPCMDSDGDLRGENCPLGPDCNEGDAALFDEVLLFLDGDEDGYGVNAAALQCIGASPPTGFVLTLDNGTDCDDTNNAVNPGATEICNGIDDDCDAQGEVDFDGMNSVCPCPVNAIGNSVYMLCPNADWADGYHTCRLYGYELARIEDDTEDTNLRGWVENELGISSFWIGANDYVTEANANPSGFEWADSTGFDTGDGTPLTYEGFPGTEPNNNITSNDYGSQGEDCTEVATFGAWNDQACAEHRPFVCETDPMVAAQLIPFPDPLLQDDFSTGTGGYPDHTKWFSDRSGDGADITINSGAIRLDTRNAGGSPRTIGWRMPSVENAELTMDFRFEENDTDRFLRIFLKGSGEWVPAGDNPPDGYALQIGPGDALQLRAYVSDVNTTIANTTLVPGTGDWQVRFLVNGDQIKAKVWQGVTEPQAWTLEATDATVTDPGKLYFFWHATVPDHIHANVDNVLVTEP
jgi:hypothetical protein